MLVSDTCQRWQWVTLFDPWPTWPISQLTRDPRDPWPATHDYSRVMTPDYCSFKSGSLSESALKIKHHHCHKIACSWNLVNLIMGQRVMSTDPWPTWPTQICWPTWPVTRWPIVITDACISALHRRREKWVSPDELKQHDESDESDCTKNWWRNNNRRVVCIKVKILSAAASLSSA